MRVVLVIFSLVALGLAGGAANRQTLAPPALAEPAPSLHAHSGRRAVAGVAAPLEGGESAFAAIAEIVTMLQTDGATDWNAVDIDALRAHLVDMHLVTLEATATRADAAEAIRFTVRGEGAAIGAIQRMTVAHAPFLASLEQWEADAEAIEDGAVLIVRTTDPALRAKASGLGYFGLMAMGAHHPEHHLAMARGAHPH